MLKTIIIFVIWVTIMFILTNFAMELISAASLFQNIMGIFYICIFFMFTLPFAALFIFIPSVTMILIGAFSTRDFYFSERLTKNWLFRYLAKKV